MNTNSRYIAIRFLGGDRSKKLQPILNEKGTLKIMGYKEQRDLDPAADTLMIIDIDLHLISLVDIPQNKRRKKVA